ncbi:hypothetical protein CXB51_006960 [Gossypium anomalum]|uniref:RNase H type-1 domain-containing protein n=1 Tax=Gossypium anomalum TaxID=47600 RepID=A0A8J5ZAM0_9ROSI|nr:hypothetical protein CXB51_006960 [Gossypium anomalum]
MNPSNYLQTDTKIFYRKLWSLYMPSKIKIIVWKISWNYMPTFSNLKLRRVMAEDRCVRCCQGEEDTNHVFRLCPITKEIWNQLNFNWVLNNSIPDLWNWFTWVFNQGTNEQYNFFFCCGLWLIWANRNKLIYEGKSSTSQDISKQIISYISELEGIKNKELILEANARPKQYIQRVNVAIYFNAAFDSQNFRSASGLVVKDEGGRTIATKSILHVNVASPFAAEAHAGFQATKLGINMDFYILDILGDSKTIITKCQNANRDRSTIGAILSDIQSLKPHFQEISFYFIPRLENTEAHRLAKEALKNGEEQYLEGGTLRSVRGEMEQNRLGSSS